MALHHFAPNAGASQISAHISEHGYAIVEQPASPTSPTRTSRFGTTPTSPDRTPGRSAEELLGGVVAGLGVDLGPGQPAMSTTWNAAPLKIACRAAALAALATGSGAEAPLCRLLLLL